ncbi:hypothetical protein BDW42DRAFT_171909 [Aspergillus taichungensis]|uniref:Protein kinase domain-containing protein n=1 Tax=Aspergillus taichungensis TaxID=482145 RepID=A0A2J5HRN6_9EURO|nr:hypothetical protein BDW42DRAFT_171909 [Aspergillus taichungensis]
MTVNSSPDHILLFQQLQEKYQEEQDQRIQVEEQARQAEEQAKQAEEQAKQAEEQVMEANERTKQELENVRVQRKLTQKTTFLELMQFCHNLLSRPLKAEIPSRSTTGKIPPPIGKYCPLRLEPWSDCHAQQREVYRTVCDYLQPAHRNAPRLFPPLLQLQGLNERCAAAAISSERGLEYIERAAVEEHVSKLIEELCELPAARAEFGLGDGVRFDSHANSLDSSEANEAEANQLSSIHHPEPNQVCIHRIDGETSTLLTSVEYKPPHKLSMEHLRIGLRPMDLWKDMVRSNKISMDEGEKLKYDAERNVCIAIVQEYHVMIQEGLEYSYVTNGLARVLLRVPHDDPSTLYYFYWDPDSEVDGEFDQSFLEPRTSVARVLCLCLMAFHSTPRGQEWRHNARLRLPVWTSSYEDTHFQASVEEAQQIPPHSDSTKSDHVGPESSSDYQPSSPFNESSAARGRRILTRSQVSCNPMDVRHRTLSPDSSGPNTNRATGRKRGFNEVASSPSAQRVARQRETGNYQGSNSPQHNAPFCTQRCLLGLESGGYLDDHCPNVLLHRRGQNDRKHPIASGDLVGLLKAQLDMDLDRNCTPFGLCGVYGAPFKLTCDIYGYTVVGKGTTSGLWPLVSREAQIYHILRKVQGSAVPVFCGTIDLAKVYFLHGAGEIRHMLVMGWGGESTAMEPEPWVRWEIRKSTKEIRAWGVHHQDLRPGNILWNHELGRALIIDFHRCTLNRRPASKRLRSAKRQSCQEMSLDGK